ncbi:Retrovirus-related Pol polyprotein from transposon RE2 [Glycine soja]|nr:Retrovirus-related Pol polyprotein from transposon RE2 [Glycine soja]
MLDSESTMGTVFVVKKYSKKGICKCTHYNGDNRVMETCFKLHGYPNWHPKGKTTSNTKVWLDSSKVPSDLISDNTHVDETDHEIVSLDPTLDNTDLDETDHEIDPCLCETTSTPNTESAIVQYNLPSRSNRGQPPTKYEPDLQAKVKYPISKYVPYHKLSQPYASFVSQLSSIYIPSNIQEALADPRWTEAMITKRRSLVAKLNTVRILLSLAADQYWSFLQFDLKNAFLRGENLEEIYMDSPPGMTDSNGMKVCKLKKALYGLKQSPRAWFGRFTKSMKVFGDRARNDQDEISSLQQYLASEFEMKQLGNLKYFFSIEVARSKHEPFKLKLLSPLKDFLESQNRKQMQKSEMLHHFDNLHRPIMCFSSRVSLADDISGHCSVASTTSSASGLRFLRSKCSRSEFELNETNPCAGRKSSSCAGTVTSGNGRLSLNSFDNSLGSKFGSEFEQDGLYWF